MRREQIPEEMDAVMPWAELLALVQWLTKGAQWRTDRPAEASGNGSVGDDHPRGGARKVVGIAVQAGETEAERIGDGYHNDVSHGIGTGVSSLLGTRRGGACRYRCHQSSENVVF